MANVWGGTWGSSWGLSIGEAAEVVEGLPVRTFYATAVRVRGVNRYETWQGGAELIQFDWSSWAQDNGAVTSVAWTVVDGTAAISSETLTSNVAQAKITTADQGRSLIKIVATSANGIDPQFIELLAKNPNSYIDDYGMCA